MKSIYLDNAATTQIDEKVLKVMEEYAGRKYGNASSVHGFGRDARNAIEKARKIIAKSIGASADEIFFTSGGTESNNLAIKGLFFSNPDKRHVITTKIEHDCVLNACKWLEKQGVRVTFLDVDSEGFVNLKELEKAITKDTLLFSVIHGNNEIGTIQNLAEIGKICRAKGVYLHTDACQSYTKTELDVKKQNLDLVTLNAHKIHGPKGVGALYIRKGINITPLAHGGGQEKGVRSGTENIPGIVGFSEAVNLASEKNVERMEELRDYFIERIEKEIENVKLNGPRKERLCNNVNLSFGNIEGEAIGNYLDSYGIAGSTGSACSSKSLEPSHVLLAIGLSPMQANTSIRLSLGKYNTKEEVDYTIETLKKVVKKLRWISPIK